MSKYKEFYLKTILGNVRGLKLTLGGTGLGKTEGMMEAVKEHFQLNPKGSRVIYSTYRHQLVSEVHRKLEEKNVSVRYLKADCDIIQTLIQENKLMDMVERLANNGLFKGDLILDDTGLRTRHFEKVVGAIKDRISLLENASNASPDLTGIIQNELDNHCRDLMNAFKNQMKRLGKSLPKKRDQFLCNEDIWELFPYVALEHSEESSVLVSTIHKLLHGFFDGKQNIKLGSIRGKFIFLDEFDFLESTILDVMTHEPNLNNPIEFVRFFFEDFDYWSEQPFWEVSGENKSIKTLFSQAMARIKEQLEKEKILFPKIRHFRVEGGAFGKSKELRLFQTNKSIVTKPFWLEEVDRSWYLRSAEPYQSIQPRILLRTFSRAKDHLLRAFQAFYQYPSHIEDIVNFVWNSKNDGQPGVYEKYIKENLAYYRGVGRRQELLGLNPKTFQTGYDSGFRLFKLRIGHLPLDPEGVQLEQLELMSSPEALIGKLSDENLVFGLSATADLPRLVKCFNMDWLSKNSIMLPFDTEDFKLVAGLKAKKALERKSTVHLVTLDELPDNDMLCQRLDMLQRIGYYQDEDEKESFSVRFRQQRVTGALKCLEWIAQHSEKSSHLMFISTFRQLRPLLTGDGLKGDEKDAWGNALLSEAIGRAGYRISIGGKYLAVAFLNAESGRRMSDQDYLREYKTLFAEEKFVLITQYQSASNGVNLLCLNKEGKEVDFGGVHLIDSQPFWLPKLEGKRYEQPEEKQVIWYLWKLLDQGSISKEEFRNCLETDHFSKITQKYKEKDDHTLNQVALFHQSIGRVERKWKETGRVEVSLGNLVHSELQKYLNAPKFLQIRQERKDTTSTLIDLIHEALLEIDGRQMRIQLQSIEQVQRNAEIAIDHLLEALKVVRNGGGDAKQRNEIRRIWEEFRMAVLNHDFIGEWTLPLGAGNAFKIELASLVIPLEDWVDLGKLHLDIKATRLCNGPKAGWQRWELEAPFVAAKQLIVLDVFSRKSLPLGPLEVASSHRQLWAPYIFQSVLKGRWGEEVICAMLSYHQVNLSANSDIPDELYELVDFRLEGHPVFIDCKHYSTATQWQFGLGPSDAGYDPAFDSRVFLMELKKRLSTVRSHPAIGASAQIFVINVASLSTVGPTYYDEMLKPVSSPDKCAIGIIPGAMDTDAAYRVSAGFQNLVNYFHSLS